MDYTLTAAKWIQTCCPNCLLEFYIYYHYEIWWVFLLCFCFICFFAFWVIPRDTQGFLLGWACWCAQGHGPRDGLQPLSKSNLCAGSSFHTALVQSVLPPLSPVTHSSGEEAGWKVTWRTQMGTTPRKQRPSPHTSSLIKYNIWQTVDPKDLGKVPWGHINCFSLATVLLFFLRCWGSNAYRTDALPLSHCTPKPQVLGARFS